MAQVQSGASPLSAQNRGSKIRSRFYYFLSINFPRWFCAVAAPPPRCRLGDPLRRLERRLRWCRRVVACCPLLDARAAGPLSRLIRRPRRRRSSAVKCLRLPTSRGYIQRARPAKCQWAEKGAPSGIRARRCATERRCPRLCNFPAFRSRCRWSECPVSRGFPRGF